MEFEDKKLKEISDEVLAKEETNFSQYATKNKDAFRLKGEDKNSEIRSPFAHDKDKIIYSGAYRRYQGKTQVIYFANLLDEEVSNRNVHTTYVSQVSRTIGKMLSLNLDLIEAGALAHDLGHAPFGHDGEAFLSEISKKYGAGEFHHSTQGLHLVDNIVNKGNGFNLTFQVRDTIISHDGERHGLILKPHREKTENDLQDYVKRKNSGEKIEIMPATLEGCVVRISDTIAYLGQDVDDAMRIDLIKKEDIPKNIVKKLGDTKSFIINALVRSVIVESYNKDSIYFDKETAELFLELRKFNFEKIYHNPKIKILTEKVRRGMTILFDVFLEDLDKKNLESKIYRHFLDTKTNDYKQKYSNVEIVRDFISTMTDRYFVEALGDYLIMPGKIL